MSNLIGLESFRFVKGIDPVANAFASTVRSDVINVANHARVFFIVYKGVGTTGTSTITVEASDDNSPSNVKAIPFYYRRANDPDTPGTVTACAATGFTTTAGSSDAYIIEVDTKALGSTGYKYVSLKAVEQAASAVVGCIFMLMFNPRYADSVTNVTS